jgi:hypothetical protein
MSRVDLAKFRHLLEQGKLPPRAWRRIRSAAQIGIPEAQFLIGYRWSLGLRKQSCKPVQSSQLRKLVIKL